MEEVVRKRLVGAMVLVLIGITLPFLLSRCMHGPSPDGQTMRVYELSPSGGIKPMSQPLAGAKDAASSPEPVAAHAMSSDTAPDATNPVITTAADTADDAAQPAPSAAANAQTTADTVKSEGGAESGTDESGLRKNVAVGAWVVQVASFSTEKDARAMAQRLDNAYAVFYTAAEVNGDTWFRVRIGPFDSDAAAKNAAAELRAQGRDTLIVRVE